jgi:hypothetical protein
VTAPRLRRLVVCGLTVIDGKLPAGYVWRILTIRLWVRAAAEPNGTRRMASAVRIRTPCLAAERTYRSIQPLSLGFERVITHMLWHKTCCQMLESVCGG